jgi:hypothetical protein
VSIVLSVATAAKGFTSVAEILPGVAFHAVFAIAGVQLLGLANRMKARQTANGETGDGAAEAA